MNGNVQPLRLALLAILDRTREEADLIDSEAGGITERERDLGWSVQGFGMLRLYVRKIGRIHIWDDTLRYPNVSMIHNHSWDLRSTVVCGSLTNIRYMESTPDHGFPFKRQRLVTGYNTKMVSSVVDTNLVPMPPEQYLPGDVYWQRAAEVHKTVARNGTVTVMERNEDENGQADVFWPSDCTWGTAKPRRATAAELRDGCAKAIELLETNR